MLLVSWSSSSCSPVNRSDTKWGRSLTCTARCCMAILSRRQIPAVQQRWQWQQYTYLQQDSSGAKYLPHPATLGTIPHFVPPNRPIRRPRSHATNPQRKSKPYPTQVRPDPDTIAAAAAIHVTHKHTTRHFAFYILINSRCGFGVFLTSQSENQTCCLPTLPGTATRVMGRLSGTAGRGPPRDVLESFCWPVEIYPRASYPQRYGYGCIT